MKRERGISLKDGSREFKETWKLTGGSVVEDEVDPGELLHSLDAVKMGRRKQERRSAEAHRRVEEGNSQNSGPSPESVPGLSSTEAVEVAGLSKGHLSLESLLSSKGRSEERRGGSQLSGLS